MIVGAIISNLTHIVYINAGFVHSIFIQKNKLSGRICFLNHWQKTLESFVKNKAGTYSSLGNNSTILFKIGFINNPILLYNIYRLYIQSHDISGSTSKFNTTFSIM
jgi:hypothetical protein